jgi:hypothetical protein
MSVTHSVFVRANRLPTTAQLNAALKKAGLDLRLDHEWNTRNDSGFWPATFQGFDAGFEWLVEPLADAELEPGLRERVARYDLVVSLVTRSASNQLASAVAVWGVLTWMTDGVAYAEESGDFFKPDQAFEVARQQIAEAPTKAVPAEPVTYPRLIHERVTVTETRRTSHSLSLEDSQRRYQVFLDATRIPSPSVFVIVSRLEQRSGEYSVLELEVNERTIRFSPTGGLLASEDAPDYAALVTKLGQTESVALALRAGGRQSAPALATFIGDRTIDLPRRRLAIITLGLMGSEASPALGTLRAMASDPTLGVEVRRAIERIEGSRMISPTNR